MKRLALITVISKSATWLQLLLLVMHLLNVSTLPQGSSTDPCEASPCGKGAECKPMGSIAICVCPNDDKGDPFVACMKEAQEDELVKPSSSAFPASAISSNPVDVHQFAASSASFDIASVQPRASPDPVTTAKPTPRPSSAVTTQRVSLITSRQTTPVSTTTTTRNPYVHVYQTTSERSPTTSSGHGYSYSNPSNTHMDDNNPESHRIPIISSNSNDNNAFPRHEYPPRPINGGSTSSPGYSSYHNGGSGGGISGGSTNSGGSYDIFNEKTVGPIAGSDYGSTSSYNYRGSSGHYSGTQGAYEYDSRPILGPSRPTPTMGYHSINRFGHHNYHPSSSGFPDPITESSNSRFASAGTGATYDIYNYNPIRNDIIGSSSDGSYSRISDPLGKYENCRMVNGIVICADNTNSFPHNHNQYHDHRHDSNSHYPNHHRGDIVTTTSNYGFHSTRDRDHYSSYYPNRYSSAPPTMTSDRYYYNSHLNNQGYPEHGPRHPIDSDASSSTYGRHPFLPKEQKISTQNVLTISSASSSSGTTTNRNDNDHPMCQSMCGINSVCRLVLNRPVCGCAEGHSGDPSVRCNPIYSERGQRREADSCERHVECKETEICAKNRCIDPCKNQSEIIGGSSSVKIDSQFKTTICGTNAECLVVGHTPVCKCNQNYFGNPYVACVA